MIFFYSIIYQPSINWFLRNLNYLLSPLLPKNIKIHPSGIVRVKIDKKHSIKLRTNQTSYVTRELFWEGSKNYEYTSIFIVLINKINSFFDIGSSIGYYSILGAKINNNLLVEAFEPSIGSMIYLSENIKLNNFTNRINVNVLALSNQIGETKFHEVRNKKYPTIYNLSGEHNIGTKPYLESKKTSIDSDTLDNFVKRKNISSVDLIKIDTEGSEHLILQKAKETIEEYKPIIICELLYNKIERQLEEIMSTHNYEFYLHTEKGLVKSHTLQREFDDGIRNCFFIHPTKINLIQEFIV
jgi:FkbM family methyltransferase